VHRLLFTAMQVHSLKIWSANGVQNCLFRWCAAA